MYYSKEEKTMWLEDWRQSGKSAWTYARQNVIVPKTFSRWTKSETEKASGFVEIPVGKKPKPELSQEILIEKGEIKIRIPLPVWIECSGIIMEKLIRVAS